MYRKLISSCAAACFVSACGTTYQMPELAEPELSRAATVIAEESARPGAPRKPVLEAVSEYEAIAAQIEPVAEAMCREETPAGKQKDCDFDIRVDLDPMAPNNAFQTVGPEGQPLVVVTAPLLVEARNHHEVAFVLGHEAGHHIADHIKKQQQQQLAGSLLLGLAAAAAGSGDAYNPYARQQVEDAMSLGAAVGGMAYSQTYELEADMLGAFIAERAGYDPEIGSRIFARRDSDVRGPDGAMSLWSTHPRSPQRVAIVSKAMEEIERQRAVGQQPRPTWRAASQ